MKSRSKTKAYTLKYRRIREGKTNYKSRLKLLSSSMFRAVVRKGINNFSVQIIEFGEKGDKALVSVHSRELLKYGWKGHRGNLPSAYLSGYLCGLKALKKKINNCVLDIGLNRAIGKSSLFAVVKGLRDAGVNIPCSEEVLPSNDMINGKNIADYAVHLGKNKEIYEKQFSKYLKEGIKPEEITKYFSEVKKKIEEKWH